MAEPAAKMSTATLEWIRPPQQARSQRTLERLLDAAEELIEDRGIEGMTIAAIVRQAGSSVGAFYARFGDKETLIRCVFERFYEQAQATAEAALDPSRWHHASVRDAIAATVLFATNVFSERRGVIAALSSQQAADLRAPAEVLSALIADKLLSLAESRGERPTHRDPSAATRTCVWLVLSALSSWAQAGADENSPPGAAENFATDVADMSIGFLFGARS